MVMFSGMRTSYTGRYSLIAIGETKKIVGNDLHPLRNALTHDRAWHARFFAGWLGYGLKHQLETLPEDTASIIPTPDICMVQPETLYRFDHEKKIVTCFGSHQAEAYWEKPAAVASLPAVKALDSNMTATEYLEKAATLIEDIHAGTLYQANLTRKFYGEFADTPSGIALFISLCRKNPAPYSAYMRVDGLDIISSSPEQFLNIDASGNIQSRPIKGTIARGRDESDDAMQKDMLLASAKNRAENLMIVDLMRHDFSAVCQPGSVQVEGMYDLTTHPHIHHLSSTISGQMAHEKTALDAVLACFPPGSMTGAPKIQAMKICSALEKQARGIYSGALGWFGGDGSAELSVVIRTLIVRGKQFEFQVGGGIVADSTPADELEETLNKAKGITTLLGISVDRLRAL